MLSARAWQAGLTRSSKDIKRRSIRHPGSYGTGAWRTGTVPRVETCEYCLPRRYRPRPSPKNYDGSRLDAEGAKDVARMFGFERTMLVLANTIKVKSWDERVSNDNREWANTIPIPDEGSGNDRHLDYVVDQSHPVLVDAFARQVRREYLFDTAAHGGRD